MVKDSSSVISTVNHLPGYTPTRKGTKMSDFDRTSMPLITRSEPEAAAAPTMSDGTPMTIRMGDRGGVLRNNGGQQVEAGYKDSWSPASAGTGIYEGRTTMGQPILNEGQIVPNSTYRVNGIEVPLQGMIDLGLIEKVDGGYRVPQQVAADDRPAPEQDAAAETFDSLSPKAAETFGAIDSVTGDPKRTEQMVFTTLSHVLNGKPEVAAADIARNLNIPRGQAQELVNSMLADVTASVAQKITHTYHDCNGDEVLEWAASNVRPEELAPIAFQLAKGDKKTLTALVERYRKARFVKAAGEGRVAGWEKVS